MPQITTPADAAFFMLNSLKKKELNDIAQKIRSEKLIPGCCPECGTNVVRRDYLIWDHEKRDYHIMGEFRMTDYRKLEPGDYTCINDHHFKVRVIDEKGNTEIK